MVKENIELTAEGFVGALDRRGATDRRHVNTQPLSVRSLRGGRRQHGRRASDFSLYVDRYEPGLRYACIGTVILSFLDAFFTLRILELGGEEVNPLMKFLIEWNLLAFVYIKLIVTTVCLIALVSHSQYIWLKLIKVSHIIYTCLLFYIMLIVYELFLLFHAYQFHKLA